MQETSSNSWQSWAQSHPNQAQAITTPRLNKYIPVYPTERQTLFLLLNHIPEILYGGAAGGAKSYGLLMAALQYVDLPNYDALLLRRTFQDLNKPKALIDISKQWLMPTDAKWNERDHRWTFPSGSTLSFGYLEYENDIYQYQGASYNFIGFDELTQFSEKQYSYLFSRLRRELGSVIPGRMRSASNPGGIGHEWVKQRFIPDKNGKSKNTPKRMFIPSKLDDNPHLDAEDYRENSLANLDIVTRARLEDGDWEVNESGGIFKREWFGFVDSIPSQDIVRTVRIWDLAGSEPTPTYPDPDYTVGTKAHLLKSGKMLISDVIRFRASSGEVESQVKKAAQLDGKSVRVVIEQEGGSAGKSVIENYQLRILRGYEVAGEKATGSKLERAKPVSAFAEGGHVLLLRAPWNEPFLQEVNVFTGDGKLHDDQVDTLSKAHEELIGSEIIELKSLPAGFDDPLGDW
jgi:predicted phage terminase large subunit-like protein